MVVLFWAIVMRVLRFLEIPSGHLFELPSPDGNFCYGKSRRCGGGMTEDNSQTISIRVREADCNSNVTMNRTGTQFDSDWLLGLGGGSKYQTSIFSQDLSYDDLSRNIDANLAEIDIEDFRSEDIHSILTLPAMFSGEFEPEKHGEQIASMSGSLLLKFEALDSASSVEQRSSDSDVSMCRSGPLFSPAREAPPMPSFSVDSLDCESYDEHELMLTCQANKGNYTITFEGSYTRCSDDSDYHDAGVSDESTSWPEQRFTPPAKSGSPADNSMVQSDYVYTTWSKLKLTNDAVRQKNSGGVTAANRAVDLNTSNHSPSPSTGKSQSLPNLLRQSLCGSDLRLSQLNVSRDSEHCVPVFDLQASQSSSASSSQHSFSLMRLFIQQKGCSGSLESSSLSMESGQESSAHINRPNPNICTTLPPDKKIRRNNDSNNSSVTDLQIGKEDIVQLHKNLMTENEKGTNVSSPRSPLEGTEKLEDSLTGPSCDKDLPAPKDEDEGKIEEDDDSDDVEMISIEDNKPDVGVCNNTVEIPYNTTVWESRPSSVDMINNFFPTSKSNASVQRIWKESLSPTSLSQGTQTKQLNSKESSPIDSPLSHLQLNNARVDSQPVANRVAPTLINNRQTAALNRKLNVTIATMRSFGTQIPVHVMDQAVQTSFIDDIYTGMSKVLNEKDSQSKSSSEADEKKSVLVCYPNYALPDLSFLRSSLSSSLNSARMYLLPQTLKSPTSPSSPTFSLPSNDSSSGASPVKRREHRPHSCPDMDSLRNRSFHHIHDWDSLSVLLPREVRNFLGNNSDAPDPATDIPRFYRSERGRSGRPNIAHRGHDAGTSTADLGPPPLPKRSISLPSGHVSHNNDADTPRSILRKPSPSRSDVSNKHRLSLHDPQIRVEENKENRRASMQEVTRIAGDKGAMKPQPCNSAIVLTPKNNSDAMLSNHLIHNIPTKVHAFPTTKIDKVEAHHEIASTKPLPVQEQICEHEILNQCEGQMYCMCDRHRGKKSVSFSENVCIRESFTPEGGNSPDGSPSGGTLLNQQVAPQELSQPQQALNILHSGFTSNCFMKPSQVSEDLEIESPPNEFCVSPLGSNSPCNSPRMQEPQPMIKDISGTKENDAIYDVQQKKDLVLAVSEAVDVLLSHFGQARDSQEKYQLGNSNLTPACGNKVLKWLCPTIYAVLNDGLQPQLYSLFGHIQNSVWSVIEASVQSGNGAGPTTRALNDLVIRLNAEDDLKQNLNKFNAFVFGLLNIRSLDTWLAYLRSRDFLLKKHYHPHSLLSLASGGGRCLFDDLLLALQPLSTLPFELDLLFEVYNINLSPMKWEEKLESPIKHSNISNYKLNHMAHQNNDHYLAQTIGKETKEFQNQQARQAQHPDSDKTCAASNDVASNVKRRWSGIQIGSRLLNAFDRRSLDDDWPILTDQDQKDGYSNAALNRKEVSSEEPGLYTTLSRPKPEGAADGGQADICSTQQQQFAPHTTQNKNLSSCKKTIQKTAAARRENESDGFNNVTHEKGGQQFKRLQQKWEELSAKTDGVMAKGMTTPLVIPEIDSPVNNVGLPSNRSRIPRLVAPSRQSKMDDSVISLRSSASGQSSQSQSSQSQEKQESFSDESSCSSQKIASHPPEKALTSPIKTNAIYETLLPPSGSRFSQENTFSPRKRPPPARTLSSPAAPISFKGSSGKANKNQEFRRPPSPPRSRSGLPRKVGARNSDNSDQDAGITAGRRK